MRKIVLIYPKLEPQKDFHYMPYSALAVASKMLADGDNVVIVDDRIEHDINSKIVYELSDDSLDENTDEIICCFSVYTGYAVTRAYELSEFIRELFPDILIAWGGPHVDALKDICLKSDLIDRIHLGYAEQGQYPMPWHLVDLKKYINPETERFIYISSYSCPGICTFCSTKNKRIWCELPLVKVEDDIDRLMQKHTYKECVFFDATVFSNKERVLKLSEIMQKHNLKWVADARAIEIINLPDLFKIVNSGLRQLTIGLESGSDKIVQQMRKGKNHLQIFEQCTKILSEYDIIMASGVIFGCPGETPEDLKETIKYIKKIRSINPNFRLSTTFFMPLPDTIMADEAKKYGYVEPSTLEEWAEYGEQNHFKYNQYQNNKWIIDYIEYKKLYDEFILENKDILV